MYSPGTFKRTSDRKVIDPNEALTVEADRRRQKSLQDYESVGVSAAAASVLVEPLDLNDKSERLVDVMAAENLETFDADALVR